MAALHSSVARANSSIPSAFAVYNTSFLDIIGHAPKLDLLVENNDYPFAHEASVYIPTSDELFMSSNMFTDPATNKTTIKVSKVSLSKHPLTAEIVNTTVPMPNGGINHDNGIVWTAQGGMNDTGGLFQMSATPPYNTTLLLSTFYGRQFNSLNDVAVSDDGSIWFTDPEYGWHQGIRPKPKLPNQVYRYDPATKDVRVVADGFGRPNGIAFSPDQKVVYITDTAETVGDGSKDNSLPAAIYAFDVTTSHGQPFLSNRRFFAMPGEGIPDGIKVDIDGNVYAGCGDGVNVWSPGGVLLGKILVKDGASNFSFGLDGRMFILNENKLYAAQLNRRVQGTLVKSRG
ncbi:unnamed protein product [Penicillium salamii]|uniref:SMP-30/Gluconolactonase/LRE-like region domain-containing protein n=1 Tax=Penicillium salamii TaxID=1612424 RepID=A0A9W4NGS7_9EURO|nr:unnamed protein product [Penicillium salamii]CAG8315617.1 unnamed protein product [Penicillium salamii]CAG8342642.1 unnamed protein product [Penicillium salamii]CAG8364749.1 unnamed protein product [Penicillium salamii]CAG8374376.1 unnamed protein product [Penicillium salamii]